MYFEKLKSLIMPPETPINTGNIELRNEVNKKLGVTLPEEYYLIIEAYGTGSFGNDLTLFNPYTSNPYLNLFQQISEWGESYNMMKEEFGSETKNCKYPSYQSEISEGFPFDWYPEKNGLILWGWIEGGGFSFHWLPSDDNWSIVVYDDSDGYKIFDMGIAEFIYKLMLGQIYFEDLCDDISEDKLLFTKC